MVELRIFPSVGLKVVEEDIVELQDEVPASKNEELVLVGK